MTPCRNRKCTLQQIKSVRKIQKMALCGPAQNAQRPRDHKSFSTRRADAFLIIHQQQIGMKLDRKSDRRTLTCIQGFQRLIVKMQ